MIDEREFDEALRRIDRDLRSCILWAAISIVCGLIGAGSSLYSWYSEVQAAATHAECSR